MALGEDSPRHKPDFTRDGGVNGFSIPQWLLGASLFCAMALFFFRCLRAAEFSPAVATGLSGLALVQPAYWNRQFSIAAILLSAAVSSVALAAISFLQRQDARRIALLGGSLAGAQLVNPLWGGMASIILPFALRRRLGGGSIGGVAGLYVSILFIPGLTAVGIMLFDWRWRSGLWLLSNIHRFPVDRRPFAASLLCLAPLLPWLARPRDSSAAVVAVLAVILLGTCFVLNALALKSEPASAAFTALAVAMVCAGAPSPMPWPKAALLLGGVQLAAWISLWLVEIHA